MSVGSSRKNEPTKPGRSGGGGGIPLVKGGSGGAAGIELKKSENRTGFSFCSFEMSNLFVERR